MQNSNDALRCGVDCSRYSGIPSSNLEQKRRIPSVSPALSHESHHSSEKKDRLPLIIYKNGVRVHGDVVGNGKKSDGR